MKLTEMLAQYEVLLDKKDQLAQDTKDNNAAIDKLKAEIAETMIDEDIPSQGYGDYVYSLQDKIKYSKRGEAELQEKGLDFFEVLREQGFGDIIKETVNANTLQSTMKAVADENDGELPPELDEIVSSYEMTDISRRKSTNKALKRAKGE
ncbi:gp33 family protein [Agathobacter sp. LCP21S3_B2]|uniref:gp33 family protein n=1 Tax=Agathobacter sp. LCP21S3_B2 TaxID=3438734 RepID=UPI003F92AEBD